LLQKFGDKQVHHRNDFVEVLASQFKLTEEELSERVSSGDFDQNIFTPRMVFQTALLMNAPSVILSTTTHVGISNQVKRISQLSKKSKQ
jgi:hypothetical protein